MSVLLSRETSRRSAIQTIAGIGAAALAVPLLDSLIGTAHAAPHMPPPVAPTVTPMNTLAGKSDVLFIPGASVEAVPMAEWEGLLGPAEVGVRSNRIAIGKENIAEAPANAAHYESKTFQYPSGAIRTLTYKKGGPVIHQITFETEIMVLSGSVTLSPLYGIKGDKVELKAGDALFMPSGILSNPMAAEDTVLLMFEVASISPTSKGSIISAANAVGGPNYQWQEGGKEMSASKPDELAKAPANALRSVVKRYAFDGNSIRVCDFEKGGKGNVYNNTRGDVLIYIPKGRVKRTEGNQSQILVAGDTTREKLGNPGYWEPLEESTFIATDAAFDPGKYPFMGVSTIR